MQLSYQVQESTNQLLFQIFIFPSLSSSVDSNSEFFLRWHIRLYIVYALIIDGFM
jgi:hypothetical protein